VILGGLVQGIRVENGAYAGGAFDWATPYAILTGFGVVAGYGLLGASWVAMKTEGELAAHARAHAKVLLLAVLAFMAAVSLATALLFPRIFARWFALPNFLYLAPVPIVTALTAFACWRSLERGRDGRAFFAAIGLFLLGYLGLVISTFPYLVPPTLTIWDTAAAPSSQAFMLVGTLILMPIILGYTGYIYWVFRGRLREGEGYH
jgi:cytochrome d ubiquinol oxidase subunit II